MLYQLHQVWETFSSKGLCIASLVRTDYMYVYIFIYIHVELLSFCLCHSVCYSSGLALEKPEDIFRNMIKCA